MPEITMNDGNKLNNAVKNNHPSRSFFPIKKPLAFTPRFGQISPFFAMRAETDDTLRLHSEFDLRTFTLKSPLLKNLTMHKNYFQVPMECILPLNWKSKIYPNPNVGDDIPQDAYTYGSWSFEDLFPPMPRYASLEDDDNKRLYFMRLIYGCRLSENIFSSNSLANSLGYDFPIIDFTWPILNIFNNSSIIFNAVDVDYNVILSFKCHDIHSFLSLVDSYMLSLSGSDSVPSESDYTALYDIYNNVRNVLSGRPQTSFNLDKLLAYQLVCAHFYSNDKVDFIYSSELWRENFRSLVSIPNTPYPSFKYNGSDILYDILSYGFLFSDSSLLHDISNNRNYVRQCYCLYQIFAYQRSLKYSDYFTSARPQPLAVGNTNVSLNTDNTVSVVDITRKIQTQRFLNQVNRTGRKFSNYIAGLFGNAPAPDWHEPKFLAHTQEVVYGSETENTGDIQFSNPNSITTQLRCNSNRYEFEVDIDRPSIIIGLISFDIERFYTLASERDNFYKDRFDMFNPYMQFIGDQAILKREYNRELFEGNFGYCTRYIEYKMSFPRAVGGFMSDALPSWIFTAKDNLNYANSAFINPEFIRSNPSELDEFYLNGVSFATDKYFHFICVVDNNVASNRPMVVNPQILG